MTRKMIAQLSVTISAIFFAFFTSNVFAESDVQIGFLPDSSPDICGCFAWLSPNPTTSGKLIYQQQAPTKQKTKYATMKIDGQLLKLQVVKYEQIAKETYEETANFGKIL